MARYRVRLQRHVVETAWVEVDATDEESAESIALDVAAGLAVDAETGKGPDWTCDEPGDGEVEIVDVQGGDDA